ncbi:unnamed protein product [Rangifer tarandus platyrhynchus]|uniref:Uncharacterized protein n=1 Tax=Rangifer tarandus platyrhynchus TaxID=3082113 RepID=A0ABN9A987_RANTA|nr:unnamed protein product [Rangifer tarandus platyrhynchus]
MLEESKALVHCNMRLELDQANEVPVRANKHIQPKLTKGAFQIAPTSENINNIRGSNHCSQCSKVNEELNQNQLEVAPEIMETPAIPAGEVHSHRHHIKKPKEGIFTRAKRTSPNNGQKQTSRSTNSCFSKATPKALVVGKEHEAKSSLLFTASQKFQSSPGLGLTTFRNMDEAWSGNRIPMPESHIKSVTVLDGFHDESPEKLDPMEQGPEDTAAAKVVAEKPIGALLSLGWSQC